MAGDAPQGHPEVQMRHIRFGSQLAHLEQSTKTNHPLNRTPLILHDEGGTGGRYFSIYKKNKGEYEEIGWNCGYNVRLLEPVNHWLMIEAWTRGGGTDSTRMLMKYEKGKYRCVRLDEFRTSENKGKEYVKTTIPKEGEE